MKVLLPEERQGKRDVRLFINKKITVMSNNFQLNPGSFKALMILMVCLVIAIEIFK